MKRTASVSQRSHSLEEFSTMLARPVPLVALHELRAKSSVCQGVPEGGKNLESLIAERSKGLPSVKKKVRRAFSAQVITFF